MPAQLVGAADRRHERQAIARGAPNQRRRGRGGSAHLPALLGKPWARTGSRGCSMLSARSRRDHSRASAGVVSIDTRIGIPGICYQRSRASRQKSLSSVIANALQEAAETDQAGGTSNNDAAARVATVASPLRRAISSTTDVTYAASVKLLSFPSTLERAPSNPASKSATPS